MITGFIIGAAVGFIIGMAIGATIMAIASTGKRYSEVNRDER